MSKKVLVIDDDPLVGGTVLTLLKRQGYKVDAVLNGTDALEKVREESYDLVISDIRMPGMDGIQAIETLQKICRESGHPCGFMFITGYAEDDAPEHAIRLGVTDVLLKPFDLQQFLMAVKKNIGGQEPVISRHRLKPYEPAGRWQFGGKVFLYEKTVAFADTDSDQHVSFDRYIVWEGEARDACFKSHPDFEKELRNVNRAKMVTHSTYQRYIAETREGDTLVLKLTAREIRKASFVLVFRFYKKDTEEFLGEGWQRLAFSDKHTGKICPIPHYIMDFVLALQED